MKIGVSSYSFSQLVNSGQMKQIDVVAKAKELGFDVIEFSTLSVPAGEDLGSFAAKLREECERVDIEIGNYTISADFLKNSDGWQAEVERLKTEVQVAEILGSPGMRHDATWGFPVDFKGARSFVDALPTLIKGCRGVSEYAAERGIKTMVENHGYFCQDSDRVEKLVSGVNHPNFGILLDIGNFLCVDEDPTQAVGKLIPYAFHVHAKDFHVKNGSLANPGQGWFESRAGNYLRGAIVGHGEVPVTQCLRLLKKANYNGIISIEFEGMEDPIKGISCGLENLKKFIDSV